jgi:hypothetical protein
LPPPTLPKKDEMEVRTLQLRLRGFGAEPAPALVELDILSAAERLKRAAMTFGAGVIAALIALPIPLVHFVFVPGALVTGATLGTLRLRQREIFRNARGSCPFCAAEQGFTVLGRFKLPKKLHCASCHRQLTLEEPTT